MRKLLGLFRTTSRKQLLPTPPAPPSPPRGLSFLLLHSCLPAGRDSVWKKTLFFFFLRTATTSLLGSFWSFITFFFSREGEKEILGLFDLFFSVVFGLLITPGTNWGSRVFWAPTFPADLVQSYKVLSSTLFFLCQYVEMVRGKRFLCYISEGCNFFFYFVRFFLFLVQCPCVSK